MCGSHNGYYNLAERIEDAFAEMDSDIVVGLAEDSEEYAVLRDETTQLKQDYRIIEKVLEGDGASQASCCFHQKHMQRDNKQVRQASGS